MDERAFWRLIDASRERDVRIAEQVKTLSAALDRLEPEALLDFDGFVWGYYVATRRRELWAAAETVMGGCSDDNFDYFREWLILQGNEVMTRAIHDPDTLADLPLAERPTTELLVSMARSAYEKRTGQAFPEHHPNFEVDQAGWPPDRISDYAWTEVEMAKLFPRLYARMAWKSWR